MSFEEELQQQPPMELEGSELPSEGMQLDGGEISLDGSNGKAGPTGNLESQSKEKEREERIWEILKANRFKRQYMC